MVQMKRKFGDKAESPIAIIIGIFVFLVVTSFLLVEVHRTVEAAPQKDINSIGGLSIGRNWTTFIPTWRYTTDDNFTDGEMYPRWFPENAHPESIHFRQTIPSIGPNQIHLVLWFIENCSYYFDETLTPSSQWWGAGHQYSYLAQYKNLLLIDLYIIDAWYSVGLLEDFHNHFRHAFSYSELIAGTLNANTTDYGNVSQLYWHYNHPDGTGGYLKFTFISDTLVGDFDDNLYSHDLAIDVQATTFTNTSVSMSITDMLWSILTFNTGWMSDNRFVALMISAIADSALILAIIRTLQGFIP